MIEKTYEIRIKNHLGDHWMKWFVADKIERLESGVTALIVRVPDQPALHGLLDRIRDLNLTLISVQELGIGLPPEDQTTHEL